MAYVSRLIDVTLAYPLPAVTIDPEINLSFLFLVIASLSPVIMPSSTSKLSDFTNTASATKVSPWRKYNKSSKTISVGNIFICLPSLMTVTLDVLLIFNVSIIILAFIS